MQNQAQHEKERKWVFSVSQEGKASICHVTD